MKLIKTTERLPEAKPLTGTNARYYFIEIEGYPPTVAMFLEDENGETAWYKDYTSKIIKPVIGWYDRP